MTRFTSLSHQIDQPFGQLFLWHCPPGAVTLRSQDNCNWGSGRMKLGLFLTTLVGLAGASHISIAASSSAADAKWAAVGTLEDGVSPYCGGGTIPMPEWVGRADGQVDIKGNTLTFASPSWVPNHSFTVDVKGLQPDGSGKVVGKDSKNREFYLTFEPGSGARPFHMTYSYGACRRVYTPKS